MSEIVKVDAKKYGIEEVKAKQISAFFKPMLDKMELLEVRFNEVIDLPINEETAKIARELRLEYVKVRTSTAAVHKKHKAFHIAAGKFLDGFKNAQAFASGDNEKALKDIEDFEKIRKAKEIAILQDQRAEILAGFDVENIPSNIGEMVSEMWDSYIVGVESKYNARIEAERVAEDNRIKKEKEDAIKAEEERQEQIRIKAENARLKKEAEEKEAERVVKEEEAERIRLAKEKKIKDAADKKIKDAKDAADKRAKEIQAEADRKAKKAKEIQDEKDRLAKIESDRKEAEQLKKDRLAEIERERLAKELADIKERERLEEEEKKAKLLAPDKDKLKDFAQMISEIQAPVVKDKKMLRVADGAKTLLSRTKDYILEKIA